MRATERKRLAAIPPEIMEGEATPESVADILVSVARQDGRYREIAARLASVLLDYPHEPNAAKLCALALVVGAVTGSDAPVMRDMLRETVAVLARRLTAQD